MRTLNALVNINVYNCFIKSKGRNNKLTNRQLVSTEGCIIADWLYYKTFANFSAGVLIRESPPQSENRIMAPVYVRSITRSTMYQKAPFC